jgi:hypothetical protein
MIEYGKKGATKAERKEKMCMMCDHINKKKNVLFACLPSTSNNNTAQLEI